MNDQQFEVKPIKLNRNPQSNWFNLFALIFIVLNLYMIAEIYLTTTDSAVIMTYYYVKWMALSLASGLPVLMFKR